MGAPSFPRFLREGWETTEPIVTGSPPLRNAAGAPGLDLKPGNTTTTEAHNQDEFRPWVNKAFQLQSRSAGKERNTESGNDDLDARYYVSNMGRFPCAELTPMRA
jgi:hypothetical protein